MFSVEEQPWSKPSEIKSELKDDLLDTSESYQTSSSDGDSNVLDSRKETLEST